MRRPGLATFALAAALALATTVAAAREASGLSKAERRVVTAIEAREPAARTLLEAAVNLNSGSNNLDGVRSVGALFRKEFDALGFTTEWIDGAAWGRAGHLIARRPAPEGTPRVVLIGHLDTVFPKDSPFQKFAPIPGGSEAHGPGLIDMKGGDVIMLLALGGLKDAGLLDQVAVTAVLIGDEEDSGRPLEAARRDLKEAARWADVAVGFEDGDGDPHTAVVARRGSGSWILTVTGHAAHSSQIWSEAVGSGAIYETARILTGFEAALKAKEDLLTVNPGSIVGGTTVTFDDDEARGTTFGKTNVVAATATVAGDLRCITLEQRERARGLMREVVAAHLPGTSASIEFDDGYPPLSPAPGNDRMLALYDRASRDLGLGTVVAVNPRNAGAADVSFTEGLVEMALDGIGLRGRNGHTPDETGDLASLKTQAQRAAILLARLPAERSGQH
ncbi:MAG TPA: M20/M25/M40 family metallo-hydrolase [Verrucomicrobiae bacterium]|nr:M20/M25/M40 family metallo-hydrolase [Verrucomicrobiae bacterium]